MIRLFSYNFFNNSFRLRFEPVSQFGRKSLTIGRINSALAVIGIIAAEKVIKIASTDGIDFIIVVILLTDVGLYDQERTKINAKKKRSTLERKV